MRWARAVWIAITYLIAICILLALFSKFDQPFETVVIALIGMVFVAVKEDSVVMSLALAKEFITVSRSLLVVVDAIGSTASDEGKRVMGYDAETIADEFKNMAKRRDNIALSPPTIIAGGGLLFMFGICLYNLIWALNH
jgi:hypothetical protein